MNPDPWAEDERFEGTVDRTLLRWMLAYARPERRALAGCVVLLLGLTSLDLAQPYLIRQAIDGVILPAAALPDAAARAATIGRLWPLVALYIGTVAFGSVIEYVQAFWLRITGIRIITQVRTDVFKHLQTLSLNFYDANPAGRLVTRVTNDVEALADMYTSVLVNLFRDLFVIVGALVVLFRLDWHLALLSLAMLPLVFVTALVFRRYARRAWRRVRARLARINARLAEDFAGMRTIQIFGREGESAEEFRAINDDFYHSTIRFIRINATFNPVLDLLTAFTVALIVWQGGYRVLETGLTVGTLYAFIAYIRRMFEPVNALADKFNILQAAMASAERLTELMGTEPTVQDPAVPIALPPTAPLTAAASISTSAISTAISTASISATARVPIPSSMPPSTTTTLPPTLSMPAPGGTNGHTPAPAVAFEDVWFAYNPGEWVLKGISFAVQPGETVAFVGHTGAGKSTIMNLVPRFYDVQRGAVRVCGADVRELAQAELRARVGIVMQDVFLFAGDVAGNIALGNPRLSGRVVDAAEIVGADPFIRRLPGAYAKPVVERGLSLSAGQRQLISFARALAYDPAILILDEATASIDTETEAALQHAMRAVAQGRTTIVVAHRLSTIQDADRIYVMDAGRIVEFGRHQELLAGGGRYRQLWELQFELDGGTPVS